MPYLQVFFDGNLQDVFELNPDVTTLGREADNDICIDNAGISSHHARIEKSGDGYRIHDVGSTNGIYFRGERVAEHPMNFGDEFSILKHTLKLVAANVISKDSNPDVRQMVADPRLQVFHKGELMGTIPLGGDVTKIGRASINDVQLEDIGVSTKHARLERRDDAFELIDNSSTNGTFINDQRVERRIIRYGDAFNIMDYKLVLVDNNKLNKQQPGTSEPADHTATVAVDVSNLGDLMKKKASVGEAALLLENGPNAGSSLPLNRVSFSIGKADSCNLKLSGWLAPKVAARITRRGSGYILEPEARGKVKHNGRGISEDTPLRNGDELSICGIDLRFTVSE